METCEAPLTRHDTDLVDLYKRVFPAVAQFVSKHSGSIDDARDVFHDTVIVFVNTRPGKANHHDAYLLGIARHLWYARFKEGTKFSALDPSTENFIAANKDTADVKKLYHLLAKAGRKCLDLLEAFYFQQSRLDAVVEAFGFGSTHSASVQKFKCIEKLRSFVKSKSLRYEDFMDEDSRD